MSEYYTEIFQERRLLISTVNILRELFHAVAVYILYDF